MEVIGKYAFRSNVAVVKDYGFLKILVDKGLISYKISVDAEDYKLILPTRGGYSQSELIFILSHLAFFLNIAGKKELAELVAKKASLIRMEGSLKYNP